MAITSMEGISSIMEGISSISFGRSDWLFDYATNTILGYVGEDPDLVLPSKQFTTPATKVGNRAFYIKLGIESIVVPEGYTDLEDYCMYSSDNMHTISLPGSVINVGTAVAQDCNGLTTVNLAEGFPIIGEHMFTDATILASIDMPSTITWIGQAAFRDCAVLAHAPIPDAVTFLGPQAFQRCTLLPNVVLPASLVEIGASAFDSCSQFTSIIIPAGVTTIGPSAFLNCGQLTLAHFDGDAPPSFGTTVFYQAHPSFQITYNTGAAGFTTPTWNGYPCFPI